MKSATSLVRGDRRSSVDFPAFTMAFQPIVDVETAAVYAYEALVRPAGGGSAAAVLGKVNERNRYAFDQLCRVTAIQWAARLEMSGFLSINFLPNAVYEAATCLDRTLDAARDAQFPPDRLIFEITENEPTKDIRQFKEVFSRHQRHGMITAIDDFGAGHSGLSMLAEFQPDIIKIDMELTRNIHQDSVRRAIARAIISLCRDLNISVIAEGVETLDEAVTLRALGVSLFQGYFFAKPAVERLPVIAPGTIDALHAAHELHLIAGDDPYVTLGSSVRRAS